jgi:hypothetical protein
VPYPDTSFSRDMQNGSKTVKIKGQEVMLKDQSFYKTAPLGDEAATNGLGAGVVTHVITGKTYFVAWSMDVKFEGQNVDRHTDLTTSNHASPSGNSMIQANTGSAAGTPSENPKCAELRQEIHERIHKNKHVDGGDLHGLEHRFREQIWGRMAPGSPGWQTHDDQIRGALQRLAEKIAEYDRIRPQCPPLPAGTRSWAERKPPTAADWRGPGNVFE